MKKLQVSILTSLVMTLTACTAPEETTKITLLKADDTTLLTNNSVITPYTFDERLETVYDTKPIETVLKDMDSSRSGYDWLISKVKDGSPASITTTLRNTYDTQGTLLSTEQVPGSEILTPAQPTIYQYGAKVALNSYFTSSVITKYGYDCVGCGLNIDGSASTSSGVRVRNLEVRQADGFYADGIKYGDYYIVASDKAFPLCTVLEIGSNHTFSGLGLTPGVPFKAIVLDRGGAIKTRHLDLYVGSERNINIVTSGRTSGIKVTVVNFLRLARNSYGQEVCK